MYILQKLVYLAKWAGFCNCNRLTWVGNAVKFELLRLELSNQIGTKWA